jgi:ferric-dicitrate binding protein FerR (iron transport regulator)
MSDTTGQKTEHEPDAVESLLGLASPRPSPPAEDEHAIRHAVHTEWRSVVGKRQSSRRYWYAGLAAMLVVAVSLLTQLPGENPPVVDVARVSRQLGDVYLLGEGSKLIAAPELDTVRQGQVLQTGTAAGLNLEWGTSGSLRMDEETRVRLVSENAVFLERGRLYFDAPPKSPAPALRIEAAAGTVRHIGTQYIAEARGDKLVVSVREGQVRIDGLRHSVQAGEGKRVALRGLAEPVVTDVRTYGRLWEWSEALAGHVDMDGASIAEFLDWVARETGYRVRYVDERAREAATETLRGAVHADPRTELRLRLATTDLTYRIDPSQGEILIRSTR